MNEEPGLLEVQENNTMITFGRKLKHLRQKNHLTQKELGMASKTKTNNIWWLHPQAPVESITLVLDIR